MKTVAAGAAILASFLLAGCITSEVRHTGQIEVKPIRDYKAEFRVLGKLHFKPGEPARLYFSLRNLDNKPLSLIEWRVKNDETDFMEVRQDDNVLLYGQPWLPGMEGPDEEAWISYNDVVETPAQATGLKLLPGNQVLVEKRLDFVEALTVSPGAERRYFFKADLNVSAVRMSTGVFVVTVSDRDPE